MDERRRITVVLFDGFELLDVFGPVELVAMAGLPVDFVGPVAGPVASSQGVEVVAARDYAEVAETDVLLVPGGAGTRPLAVDSGFLAWLRSAGEQSRLVTSVCTGSALLAAAGLLDGRRATSNKRAWAWASGFGEGRVTWVPQARWVEDGDRWTSSGVAAGMDMAVALIAHLLGPEVARAACDRIEYEPHADADHDPFAALHGLV